MAMQQAIVTGVPQLDKKLRELPIKLQKKLVRQAIRKGSKEISLAAAKRDVPVNTGKLAGTLVVRAMKRRRGKIGNTIGTKEGQYPNEQFPGAFLEYGTKERIRKSGGSTGAIQKGEFGYLRKSIYDNQKQIHGLFVDDVLQLIKDAAQPTK